MAASQVHVTPLPVCVSILVTIGLKVTITIFRHSRRVRFKPATTISAFGNGNTLVRTADVRRHPGGRAAVARAGARPRRRDARLPERRRVSGARPHTRSSGVSRWWRPRRSGWGTPGRTSTRASRQSAMGLQAILILFVVYALIATWVAAGTIPSLMYYGLDLLTPTIFLPSRRCSRRSSPSQSGRRGRPPARSASPSSASARVRRADTDDRRRDSHGGVHGRQAVAAVGHDEPRGRRHEHRPLRPRPRDARRDGRRVRHLARAYAVLGLRPSGHPGRACRRVQGALAGSYDLQCGAPPLIVTSGGLFGIPALPTLVAGVFAGPSRPSSCRAGRSLPPDCLSMGRPRDGDSPRERPPGKRWYLRVGLDDRRRRRGSRLGGLLERPASSPCSHTTSARLSAARAA